MLAELEILPVGTQGTSLSAELSKVARLIHDSGLNYRIGPMGTVVEGEWADVMALAKRCHEALLSASGRVITTIKLDDRLDRQGPRIDQKVASLEAASGIKLKR